MIELKTILSSVNLLILILGACWGSFLNVLAVRGLSGVSLFDRSLCVACRHILRWWELIPILSWLMLRGRCATCGQRISSWYPFIESISTLWICSLFYLYPVHFFPALFIFSSALIVTMRTDGEYFLILRWCTIGIIPVGLLAAYCGLLPITFMQSMVGCIVGAGYLMAVQVVFLWWKGYEGLGEGDIELIAAIGSFLGLMGMLSALVIASCLATMYGLVRLAVSTRVDWKTPLPFGLFLALGSWGALLMKSF